MNNEAEATVQRRRRTRAEIAQIVARFADSELTRTEFCRRQGISLATLSRHLRSPRQTSNKDSNGLVAVELVGANNATDRDRPLALVLARGRRIEVGAGFDAATLERLIVLLEKM
jgi:DNA-binding transcriptional ArsR family regulator